MIMNSRNNNGSKYNDDGDNESYKDRNNSNYNKDDDQSNTDRSDVIIFLIIEVLIIMLASMTAFRN